MGIFHLKFPILIHLLHNKANHFVLSFEDLPTNHYFKILQTGINPNNPDIEIEVDYRRVDQPVSKEVGSDEQTQENIEASGSDIEVDGASDKGGPDIGGSGL